MFRSLGRLFISKQQSRHCTFNPYPRPPKPDPRSNLDHVKHGLKLLKIESKRWLDENIEALKFDKPNYYPGEVVPQFQFKTKEDLDQFQTITDMDNDIGNSTAEVVLTDRNTALFRGVIDTRVPKDGQTVTTGYAVLQSYRKLKSFIREDFYDWQHWSHLIIRCRGDGRNYVVNLSVYTNSDSTWHLVYQFPLYTRGGPYWQTTHIPFSKFLQVYKGIVQDRQGRIPLNRVTKVAIALMDNKSGPFEIELDYIACKLSCSDAEEFAYETYETPLSYSPAA